MKLRSQRPTTMQMAQSSAGGMTTDQEYVNLKFREWKSKMTCATCKYRENEIILPCGHMYCQECIQSSFQNRQRICPLDAKKIS